MKYSITKFLSTSVLSLLITLLLMQGSVYFWSRNVITKEIEETTISNAEYLLNYLEDKVLETYLAAQTIMESTTTTSFFTKLAHNTFESTAEYYTMLRQITKDLDVLKYSNSIIEDVTIMFPTYDLLIGTESLHPLYTSDFDRIKHSIAQQSPYFFELDGELYSTIRKPNNMNIEFAKMVCIVRFDQSILMEILSSYTAIHSKTATLYNPATSYFLASSPLADDLKMQLKNLPTLQQHKEITRHELEVDHRSITVFCGHSSLLKNHIFQIIPTDQLNNVPKQIGLLLVLLFVVTASIIVVFLHALNKTITRPVSSLNAAFKKAGDGNFSTRLPAQDAKEFDQLASGFNFMAEHLDALIDANYRQTIRLQATELKVLQTQINPHFLYNSFYFLRYLITSNETGSAEDFCKYLGRYFQYITRNESAAITLKEEYDHALDYLNIQLMRFGDTITSHIELLPESVYGIPVPRLILEPVVENCFKHGINIDHASGNIRISFAEAEDSIDIIVENNGTLLDETLHQLKHNISHMDDKTNFTGLVNTHQRLILFYGKDSGLQFERSPLGGLLVRIQIMKYTHQDRREAEHDAPDTHR